MLEAALLIAFPALMAYAAASDLLTMRIPNALSIALVAAFAGLALAAGLSWNVAAMHVAAGSLALAIGFAMFACGWIGGGDAKLAAASALWLGFDKLLDYLLVASIAGGLLSVAIMLLRAVPLPAFALGWPWLSRLHEPKGGIPYGIALAGAALVIYPRTPIWLGALS